MDRRPLDVTALRAALAPRWRRVDVVPETGSTNADLLEHHDAPDRTVLVAERQTAGRGRLDRSWTSESGAGLTFSVLLRPQAPIATWGWLPLLAGVALHAAVSDYARIDVALKWPNDLLAGPERRKAAGVLAQTSGDAVVIGIGLNVSATADELPPAPEPVGGAVPLPATSLALSGAADLDRAGLLVAILAALDSRVAQWEDVRGDADACGLAATYRQVCATIGQPVSVVTLHGEPRTVVGIASGIDADGRLLVETASGPQVIGAGDVQHVRPAG